MTSLNLRKYHKTMMSFCNHDYFHWRFINSKKNPIIHKISSINCINCSFYCKLRRRINRCLVHPTKHCTKFPISFEKRLLFLFMPFSFIKKKKRIRVLDLKNTRFTINLAPVLLVSSIFLIRLQRLILLSSQVHYIWS